MGCIACSGQLKKKIRRLQAEKAALKEEVLRLQTQLFFRNNSPFNQSTVEWLEANGYTIETEAER